MPHAAWPWQRGTPSRCEVRNQYVGRNIVCVAAGASRPARSRRKQSCVLPSWIPFGPLRPSHTSCRCGPALAYISITFGPMQIRQTSMARILRLPSRGDRHGAFLHWGPAANRQAIGSALRRQSAHRGAGGKEAPRFCKDNLPPGLANGWCWPSTD